MGPINGDGLRTSAAGLAGILRNRRWRAVVSNSARSALLVGAVKPPTVPHIYYVRDALTGGWITGMRRRGLQHLTLRRSDAFLVNSDWTGSMLPRIAAVKPVRRAWPICGTESLDRAERARSDPAHPLRVLSLSRITPWKGIHVLQDALDILARRGQASRYATILAGGAMFDEDDYLAEVLRRAIGHRIPVEVTGHQSDIASLLARSDVLVLASTLPEPFGQVVVQAMHAGLVVIATNHGGPTEVITNGKDGLLVPPNDPAALADQLSRLADDAELVRELSNAGMSTSMRFTDRATARGLDEAIAQILRELGGRPAQEHRSPDRAQESLVLGESTTGTG